MANKNITEIAMGYGFIPDCDSIETDCMVSSYFDYGISIPKSDSYQSGIFISIEPNFGDTIKVIRQTLIYVPSSNLLLGLYSMEGKSWILPILANFRAFTNKTTQEHTKHIIKPNFMVSVTNSVIQEWIQYYIDLKKALLG